MNGRLLDASFSQQSSAKAIGPLINAFLFAAVSFVAAARFLFKHTSLLMLH
jgi:hypothetical protein